MHALEYNVVMVLINVANGGWHEPARKAFDNEKELQDLVKLSPALLPGGEPLAVVDELHIPGVGYVDLVGVGAHGELVIVECKLKANPEIRREVVGQVFAYAGGIWRLSFTEFKQQFEARTNLGLFESVQSATSTELDEAEFEAAVTANLASGSFRLVVAVDQITAELRTIIEFVNSHTIETVQVQALELDYSRDGAVELLNPVVYGVEAPKKATTAGTKWTAVTVDEQITAKCTTADAAWLRRLIEHAQRAGHLYFGSGVTPGMSGRYTVDAADISLWSIYLYDSGPRISVNMGTLAYKASAQRAFGWLGTLNSEPALAPFLAEVTEANLNKYPSIPASVFVPSVADLFLSSIDRLIG